MDPMSILGSYKGLLDPWRNIGLQDFQHYSDLSNQLTSDPVGWYSNIMNQYQMSPGAQEQSQFLNQQVANAAAQGGDVGTPNEQMAMGNQMQRLIDQDQQQYYQDVMQPFTMGFGGLQHGSDLGFKATTQMGDLFANQAMMAAAKKAQGMGMMGQLMGLGGGIASKLLPSLLHGGF